MPAHKTVELQLGRGKVAIDELLAPLIRLVWARGIRTLACCQEPFPGLPGWAWVAFQGTEDVRRFFDLAGRDFRVQTVVTWKRGRCQIHLEVLIPHRDIPAMVEAFGRHRPERRNGAIPCPRQTCV